MHKSPIDWNDVLLVLTVARLGSFSRAAAELGINQATVSRRIDQLEDAARVPLFIRRPTGATLTAAGRRLADASEATSVTIDNFNRVFRTLVDNAPPLTISAPEGLTTYFLGPCLTGTSKVVVPRELLSLSKVFSGVPPITFLPSTMEADIEVKIIGPGESVRCSSDFIVKKIGGVLLSPVSSINYLAGQPGIFNSQDFTNHKIVSHAYYEKHIEFSEWREVVYANSNKATVVAATTSGLHKLIHGGAGIALLPIFAQVYDGALFVLPSRLFSIELEIWICAHPETLKSPSARIVFDYITYIIGDSNMFSK